MMKTLVILFAPTNSLHIFDKLFNGNSSFYRSLKWATEIPKKMNFDFPFSSETVVFCQNENISLCQNEISSLGTKIEVICKEKWDVTTLFESFSDLSLQKNADSILFSFADCPFLNFNVTKEIIEAHKESLSEYTFADGYPYGFAPEMLDSGSVRILFELSKTSASSEGIKQVSRTSIFDLIKTDINSFDVETVIADEDAGLYRLNFNSETKQNTLSCVEMFFDGIENKDAGELSKKAFSNPKVLKTVPAYYSIQITDKVSSKVIYHPKEVESLDGKSFMKTEDFTKIIDKIADFSETAVVSLSAWGDATLHPDFAKFVNIVLSKPNLTVLIEGDCAFISENDCKTITENFDFTRVLWLITLDAFKNETYLKIHSGSEDNFEKSKNAILLLQKYFPGNVYPQFTRMNENEEDLESFYRFWSAKDSFTKGKCAVQKYESLCSSLPERKSADLAPLERNVCWHLRRDVTVLLNGNVPFCRGCIKDCIIGNILTDDLTEIWKKTDSEVLNQIKNVYSEKCGKCDEYYIFNF